MVVAHTDCCLRAIQLATAIFRANNGPDDERQTNKKRRKTERIWQKTCCDAFFLVAATLTSLIFCLFLSLCFFLSLLSHCSFTLFVLQYARRHRRRLCGLPHAMMATLPEQLLSSVGFIDNSQAKQRFRGWRDNHDRITKVRGKRVLLF